MKILAGVLSLLTLALGCGVIGFAQLGRLSGNPIQILGMLLDDSLLLPKILSVFLVFVGLANFWVGVLRWRIRFHLAAPLVIVAFIVGPIALGILAGAYTLINAYIAMVNTHTTNLAVVAPMLAGALIPPFLGALAAAVAAAPGALLKRENAS